MKDEGYNGWVNRETWAMNLYLSNDEGFYNEVNEIVNNSDDKWDAEKDIKEYVEGLEDMITDGEAGEGLINMFRDIGSLWRVNWEEIAGTWREE